MANPNGNRLGNRTERRGKPTIRRVVLDLKTARVIRKMLLAYEQDYTRENVTALLKDWAHQQEQNYQNGAEAKISSSRL